MGNTVESIYVACEYEDDPQAEEEKFGHFFADSYANTSFLAVKMHAIYLVVGKENVIVLKRLQ